MVYLSHLSILFLNIDFNELSFIEGFKIRAIAQYFGFHELDIMTDVGSGLLSLKLL